MAKIEKFLMKMIDNFINTENYTSKTAAASLIPVIYSSNTTLNLLII